MDSLRSSTVLFPTSLPPLVLNPITTSILLAAIVAILLFSRKTSNLPHANPPSWFTPTTVMQLDAVKNGMNVLDDGLKRFAGRPFRMINNNGEMIVLPSRCINSIRNEEGLSFARAIMNVGFVNYIVSRWKMLTVQDFHTHVSGFSPVGLLDHRGQVLQNVARKPLTKLLSKFDIRQGF